MTEFSGQSYVQYGMTVDFCMFLTFGNDLRLV
jgi:hypothetical protein